MPEKTRKPATESAANPETPKKRTNTAQKNRPLQAEIKEIPQCRIHDKVEVWEVDDIRANVCCNDEPPTEHTDGKHYCLFHLPTKEKAEKFAVKFKERLEKIEKELKRVENLPEEEREAERWKIRYDFRYVWFPSWVSFSRYKFSAVAYFSSATFSADAYFSEATFSAVADFSSATFSAVADFSSATFSAIAYFSSATFSADAYFSSATFSAVAYFSSATFSAVAYFSETTFSAVAYFSEATFSAFADFTRTKFSKTNSTSFQQAKFTKKVFFDRARFRNFITFESAVFEDKSDVFFRRSFFASNANFQYCTAEGYLRFSNLRQGLHSKFDFQEAAFEKADRVSFHTVRLQPNWFVNVDARKFVFTDIKWENVKAENGNENIGRELESLKERGIKDSRKHLLEVASRRLADNAEQNNRYEEASKFRYMAMETRRLEHSGWRRFFNLHNFYKLSSGYGENWRRAALVLAIILGFFALLYAMPFANFDYSNSSTTQTTEKTIIQKSCDQLRFQQYKGGMNVCDAIIHSINVAALQRPEPKPADWLMRSFVIAETIFAPLQAALLALAIRRKFMR